MKSLKELYDEICEITVSTHLFVDEYAGILSDLGEALKDAERYRWLRSRPIAQGGDTFVLTWPPTGDSHAQFVTGEELDSIIDLHILSSTQGASNEPTT